MVDVFEYVDGVLREDIGRGDLYAKVAKPKKAKAKIVAKSSAILSGVLYANEIAKRLDIEIKWKLCDGDRFEHGDLIATLHGLSTNLLICERAILNTILHSSSIATNTHRFVNKISNYNVKILDTRKTRPLLRSFEKYSVRVGGGTNHRLGLDDSLMLKDTHLMTIKNLKKFIKKARKSIPFTSTIEVESATLEDAMSAMEAGADIVMCDNMSFEEIAKVVAFRDKAFKQILIEVSGNVTLDNIETYAKIGIDAISSGSMTHQAQWPDISMKFL